MAVPKLVQESVAKAQAILAAKKAAASAAKTTTAPKATTPAKTTSTPKVVSTPAKATVSPGLNIVNQIIAGDITPGTVVTYEPVKQPEPEQPKTVITPEHLSQMNTITSTRTSSGEQYVRTEYTQTPEGMLQTKTTTFVPSKSDSSVKAIPETQQSIQNRQDAALAKTGWMGATVVAGKKALGPVMNATDYLWSLRAVSSPTGGIAIGYTDKSLKEVTTNVQAKGNVLWSNLVNKKYAGATTDVLLGSSTMTDIVLPVATGGAFKYISLGAKAATVGGLTEKAYKYFVRPTQAAIQYGVVPATLGTEIGMTAAQNPKALGTFGAKTSLQFIMMGVGYNSITPKVPKIELVANIGTQGKVQEFSVQKYKEIFGKQIRYGEEIIFKPKVSTGYEPNFKTYKAITEMGKVETPVTIKGTLKPAIRTTTGYEPNIDTYTGARYIDTYRTLMGGDRGTSPITIKGTLKPAIKTSTGWEPSYETYKGNQFFKPTSLSTKVWPKMMRIEETLPWGNYLESGGYLFEGKPIATLKPRSYTPIYKPKQFNFRDIVKETKMPEGGQISGGRLKTITIQEQKIKVETKSLQVTKPVTEKQYLETILQQKLDYKVYREPTLKTNLSFEEPTYIYASLSSQQQTQQPKMTFQSPFKSTTTNQIQRNIQTQIQNITQNQNQIQLPRYDVSKISLQGISQIQVQGTSQKQTYSQTRIQNQIQEQMQEQMQDVIQMPELRQTQETKQDQIRIFKLPSLGTTKEEQESLKGYNVYIKERHYFKGKKKKPTTWFKASKYSLTKEQALALGATAVNRSAAASFKIVPTEGEPKKLGFGVDSWGNLSGNFYMKGNTFIEKTPYRINTQGEIKGISALGWITQRQRPYQSPTKIRYTPTTNAKPMKPIQQINININKIMKGWKL